jgi:hypothetical protein
MVYDLIIHADTFATANSRCDWQKLISFNLGSCARERAAFVAIAGHYVPTT